MDLSNKEFSTVVVSATYLSNLLAVGRAQSTTLFDILRQTTAEAGKLGSWLLSQLSEYLRIGAVATVTNLGWRF